MSNCPACDDELIVFELGGVEIDHCAGCRGTWLDGGELEMIVEFAGAESGPFTRAIDDARGGEKTKRRCPRCTRRMRLIHVGENPGVEIDRCPKAHGLWFDRGEMKRVIESLDGFGEEEGGEGGAISRFFADLYHHEFQEPSEKGQEA